MMIGWSGDKSMERSFSAQSSLWPSESITRKSLSLIETDLLLVVHVRLPLNWSWKRMRHLLGHSVRRDCDFETGLSPSSLAVNDPSNASNCRATSAEVLDDAA